MAVLKVLIRRPRVISSSASHSTSWLSGGGGGTLFDRSLMMFGNSGMGLSLTSEIGQGLAAQNLFHFLMNAFWVSFDATVTRSWFPIIVAQALKSWFFNI